MIETSSKENKEPWTPDKLIPGTSIPAWESLSKEYQKWLMRQGVTREAYTTDAIDSML